MSTWEITKDFDPDPKYKAPSNMNAVGMMGPRLGDFSRPRPYLFRMYGDDGDLMYEGRATEIDFSPLDDFGTPNVGCTYIQYFIDGKWETL